MKTPLRILFLLLVLATVWSCKKDSGTGNTPDPTPVLSLEQRLMKAGLTFYGLKPEDFQATPFEKKDPPGFLKEENVAAFEEAQRRGKFKPYEVLGVKFHSTAVVDSKFNGVEWIVANYEKYPFDPSREYTFLVVGKVVRDNSAPNNTNDALLISWKRK